MNSESETSPASIALGLLFFVGWCLSLWAVIRTYRSTEEDMRRIGKTRSGQLALYSISLITFLPGCVVGWYWVLSTRGKLSIIQDRTVPEFRDLPIFAWLRRNKSLVAVISASILGLFVLGSFFDGENENVSVTGSTPIASSPPTDAPTSEPPSTQPPEVEKRMPNVVGMTWGEARVLLDNQGLPFPDYIDLIENRSIWDGENWTVKSQLPSTGTLLDESDRICLGVVKLEEAWRENFSTFSCWQDAPQQEKEAIEITFTDLKDIIQVNIFNSSKYARHYRIVIGIEYDLPSLSGITLKIPFCTNTKVQPGRSQVSMELIVNDDFERLDRDAYIESRGRFRYEILEVQSNSGSSCVYD